MLDRVTEVVKVKIRRNRKNTKAYFTYKRIDILFTFALNSFRVRWISPNYFQTYVAKIV